MTTATTLTPAAFLLARLADDEASAWDVHTVLDDDELGCVCGYPARVLAQVAALRAVVELHSPTYSSGAVEYGSEWIVLGKGELLVESEQPMEPYWCAACDDMTPCPTLLALCQPFADHPDFAPAWLAS